MKLILRRKLFHLVGIVAFLPVALYDGEFLAFSVCVAFSLGVILECARLHRVSGTASLTSFMSNHIDARDKGVIGGTVASSCVGGGGGGTAIRTHLYLVLGFALSIIIYMRQQMVVGLPLAPPLLMSVFVLPGIIGLGVMDATAAVAGSLWKTRTTTAALSALGGSKKTASTAIVKAVDAEIEKGTLGYYLCRDGSTLSKLFPAVLNPSLKHKTVAGTVSAVVVGLLLWVGVFQVGLLGVRDYRVAIPSVVAVVVGGFAEATMEGIDNLELPLIMSGILQTTIALVSLYISGR
jgi:dolichol kinase